MADACIVCLQELATSESYAARSAHSANSNNAASLHSSTTDDHAHSQPDMSTAVIGHILPCSHNFHDECLRPWVERCNSCPICRRDFFKVEVKQYVNGPTQESYRVQAKKQAAVVHPETTGNRNQGNDEDPAIEPCMVCNDFGDEGTLLLCDGCNMSCHTFCADLDNIPSGPWFCHPCLQYNIAHPYHAGQDTLGQGIDLRRSDSREDDSGDEEFDRLWQEVTDGTGIDLDFPYDDENSTDDRSDAESRAMAAMRARLRIAEQAGAAAAFRATRFRASVLELIGRRPADSTSPDDSRPDSQDELRAWNAFEKHQERDKKLKEQANKPRNQIDKPRDHMTDNILSTIGRNKRKSRTSSPVEPPASGLERRLKRPRTRRVPDGTDAATDAGIEGGSSARRSEFSGSRSTLLGDLLKEIPKVSAPSEIARQTKQLPHAVLIGPIDHASPVLQSSISSPSSSNHPSPMMMPASPVSSYHSRPTSPTPLTSRIEPVFAVQGPQFSPVSPASRPLSDSEGTYSSNGESSDRFHQRKHRLPMRSRVLTTECASLARFEVSLSTKELLANMVAHALKPAYKKRNINDEEYTAICRQVARLMYKKAGESKGTVEDEEKDKWQSIASHEVNLALHALKKKKEDGLSEQDQEV